VDINACARVKIELSFLGEASRVSSILAHSNVGRRIGVDRGARVDIYLCGGDSHDVTGWHSFSLHEVLGNRGDDVRGNR
jgi:hypothetical protein